MSRKSETEYSKAASHFLGQDSLESINLCEFHQDYDVITLTYLVHLQQPTKCLRYVFKSGVKQSFVRQLECITILANLINCPAVFISPAPAEMDSSHFICGVMFQNQLLLINPLGEHLNNDITQCFSQLCDTTSGRHLVSRVYISSDRVQKDPNGQSSCGPICVELVKILSQKIKEIQSHFELWSRLPLEKEKVKEQLKYFSVSIEELCVSDNLRNMTEETAVAVMRNIREGHCEELKSLPLTRLLQSHAEKRDFSIAEQNIYLDEQVINAPEQIIVWKMAIEGVGLDRIEDDDSYKILIERFIETDNKSSGIKVMDNSQNKEAIALYEFDVPGDDSCLFWSTAIPYLLEALNDEDPDLAFQANYLRLFGKIDCIDEVKRLVRKFNPFLVVDDFYNNKLLQSNVREAFRSRVINLMASEERKKFFLQYYGGDSFEDYLNRMQQPSSWGGMLEIHAISELLSINIELHGVGTPQNFPDPFYKDRPVFVINHVEFRKDPWNPREKNHFHFRLRKELGEKFKRLADEEKEKQNVGVRAPELSLESTFYKGRESLPLLLSGSSLRNKRSGDWSVALPKDWDQPVNFERVCWSEVTTGAQLARLVQHRRPIYSEKATELVKYIIDSIKHLHTLSDDDLIHFINLCLSEKIHYMVMDVFTSEIKVAGRNPKILDFMICGLMRALLTLIQSKPKKIDQDNLLNIYIFLFKYIAELHSRNPDAAHLITALRSLCHVTDAMVDAQVEGIKKKDLQNPAYDILNSLKTHIDPEAAFLANYAQQGLLRVPSDQTKTTAVIEKLTSISDILDGIGTIGMRVASTATSGGTQAFGLLGIPKQLVNIYKAWQELRKSQIHSEFWYEHLRYADTIFDALQQKDTLLPEDTKWNFESGSDPNYYRGVVYRFEKLLQHKPVLISNPGFAEGVIELFKGLLTKFTDIDDVWVLGRVGAIVMELITRNPRLNQEKISAFLTDIKGRFDKLSGETERHRKEQKVVYDDDLMLCIRYAFILIFFGSDENVIRPALNFLEVSYQEVGNNYLSKFLIPRKNNYFNSLEKAAKKIRVEILNCFKVLRIHGSSLTQAQVDQSIDLLMEHYDPESRSKVKFTKDKKKNKQGKIQKVKKDKPLPAELELLKSHNLDKPQYLVKYTDPKVVTFEAKNEFVLLRNAKESYRSNFIDLGEITDHLLGSYFGEIKSFDVDDEKFDEQRLYIPVSGKLNNSVNETSRDMKGIVDEFVSDQNSNPVLLITGDTGSGKSMFALKYAKQLAQNFESAEFSADYPIPFFVSLALLRDPGNNLISQILENFRGKHFKVGAQLWDRLKQEYKIVFVLDGYDEMNQYINLFIQNRLKDWPRAKFIITCRTQWLFHQQKWWEWFSPDQKLGAINRYDVAPFDNERIEQYIVKYLRVKKKINNESADDEDQRIQKSKAECLEIIRGINGLGKLVSTPFHLRITMDIMDELRLHYKNNPNDEILQLTLYEKYMDRHFRRQVRRLIDTGQLENLSTTFKNNLTGLMNGFCKQIAKKIKDNLILKGLSSTIRYNSDYDGGACPAKIISNWGEPNDEVNRGIYLYREGYPLHWVLSIPETVVRGIYIYKKHNELFAQVVHSPGSFDTINLSQIDDNTTKLQLEKLSSNSVDIRDNKEYPQLVVFLIGLCNQKIVINHCQVFAMILDVQKEILNLSQIQEVKPHLESLNWPQNAQIFDLDDDELRQIIVRHCKITNPDQASIWHEFLKQDDETTIKRTGWPQEIPGPNQVRFLHDSLLDYYLSLFGFDRMKSFSPKAIAESARQVDPGREPEKPKEQNMRDYFARIGNK